MCKDSGDTKIVETEVPKTVTKNIQVPKKVMRDVQVPMSVKKQVMAPDGTLTLREVTQMVIQQKEVEEMVEETVTETIMEKVQTSAPGGYECIWVDEHAIDEYVKRGYTFTGEKRMSYCPPEWIADKQTGGILLLDDFNRADARFLQATMELIDRQTYISWKLPKDWHILLSANPDNGEYLVNTIDNAQKTRFVSINLKFEVNPWARWAEESGIDGRCINFLLLHPEMVTGGVNPRSITNFFNAISSIKNFEEQLPLIQMIGEGSVGAEFTTMFSMFINNKLDKLITPEAILLNDSHSYVIGALNSCIGVGVNYRADIASILTTRLINYTINYSNTNTITPKIIERITKLTTDDEVFTDDLKYVIIKKILAGNKTKFQKLLNNEKVMKMAMK